MEWGSGEGQVEWDGGVQAPVEWAGVSGGGKDNGESVVEWDEWWRGIGGRVVE